MATALITHSACLYHDTPLGHPESADRLRAVLHALEAEEFMYLLRDEAPRATREQLARVHAPELIDAVLGAVPDRGYAHIDNDTVISPGSGEAALRAAGACVRAVDLVMDGRAKNAFCAVRPPGHHAEPRRAMGFCLFNNVAVAAYHARAAYGLERVAAIDFDVHHGNGTQAAFRGAPGLFYGSVHQHPLFPMTGRGDEPPGAGVVNAPLPARAGGEEFRAAMETAILPALDAFAPEFVLISAGFDAHRADPLADLRLTEADFAWATQALCALAQTHAQGRVVSVLEGGYDLRALAGSAAAHVRALMEG